VRLHVENGTDVTPAGGGFIQAGRSNSINIALDDNEIMARNNGAPTTLVLNNDGGLVKIGQDFATTGDENLRIIRRSISDNGTRLHGSGFTVSHPGTGDYLITFTTPFAATPTVTASLEYVAASSLPRTARPNAVSAGSANIVITLHIEFDVSFEDEAFHFIAVGPR
jgi:hypothetical protein